VRSRREAQDVVAVTRAVQARDGRRARVHGGDQPAGRYSLMTRVSSASSIGFVT